MLLFYLKASLFSWRDDNDVLVSFAERAPSLLSYLWPMFDSSIFGRLLTENKNGDDAHSYSIDFCPPNIQNYLFQCFLIVTQFKTGRTDFM